MPVVIHVVLVVDVDVLEKVVDVVEVLVVDVVVLVTTATQVGFSFILPFLHLRTLITVSNSKPMWHFGLYLFPRTRTKYPLSNVHPD